MSKQKMEKPKKPKKKKLISLKDEIINDENQNEMEDFVERLSIPRLLGTKNEEKAVNLIIQQFENKGLKVRKYPFWATRYWTDVFIRRSMGILVLLGLLIAIASTRNLDWTYGIMIVMGIFGIFIFKNLTRQDLPIVGEKFKSVDLRVDIPPKTPENEHKNKNGIDQSTISNNNHKNNSTKNTNNNNNNNKENNKKRYKLPKYKKKFLRFFDYYEDLLQIDSLKEKGAIIIMAHHDSKSQPLKTYVRAALFTACGLSFFLAVIFFIITSIMETETGTAARDNPLRFAGYVSMIVAIITAVPLVFNGVDNNSMGAMDNASGCAVVYEIAKYFKEHPLKNYRIICLINGAEEVSTLGSRYISPVIKKEINDKPAFVLNYDMVGLKDTQVQFIEGSMMTREVPYLKKLAYDTASKMYIPTEGFSFAIGAMTDGFIFSEAGFKSIDFVNRRAAFFTHTKEDTPDKFDGLAGLHYVALAAGMMKRIDTDDKVLEKKNNFVPSLKRKKKKEPTNIEHEEIKKL